MKTLIISLMFVSLGAVANDAPEKEVRTAQLVKLLIKNAANLKYEIASNTYSRTGKDISSILTSALFTGSNADEDAVSKSMTSVCHGVTPEAFFGAKVYNCQLSIKTQVMSKPELNHTITFDMTVEQAYTVTLSNSHIVDNSVKVVL